MSVKDLYRRHPVSESDQRKILDLAALGLADMPIALLMNMRIGLVTAVREYGIVTASALKKPERCECGAKLVAKPCLACQLRGKAA